MKLVSERRNAYKTAARKLKRKRLSLVDGRIFCIWEFIEKNV